MESVHARYPFFEGARAAVDEADVDLGELVAREDAAAVERAVGRVTTALTEGDVGAPSRRTRTELLSYPVARVLVSLVDEPVVTQTYAQAEAATAVERVRADVTESADLSYGSAGEVTLAGVLAEFELADAVTPVDPDATREAGDPGGTRASEGTAEGLAVDAAVAVDDADAFHVDVTAYLALSTDLEDASWRLRRRELAGGLVPVTRDELLSLLRRAIEDRVAAGLPLTVPDPVANELGDALERVQSVLADIEIAVDVDRVAPELFPPCMTALLERARSGESLPAHSWFSLCSFCATIGMDEGDVMTLLAVEETTDPVLAERVRYGLERVGGDDGVEYPPPSCETMDAYGDCVNKDDLCAEIEHPTQYYEIRIERAGD